jgi:FkbM family methyltransferase
MNPIELRYLAVGPCRHGLMVWPKSDATIGKSLALYGEFAEGENDIMARYLQPGDVAIDIGANLGTTLLPMARRVGTNGRVLAFEPQPLIAQCLLTSLTLNEIFNVQLLSCGVGAHSGWAAIPWLDESAGGNYGAVALAAHGTPVPLLRLDDVPLERCSLIKIDVEGHEWPVIQGACQTIERHRPVLYLEAKRSVPGTQLWLEHLMALGWRCYWHFAFFYRKDNFRGEKRNVFGGTGDMNVLAVPPELEQPEDLPPVADAAQDWQTTYAAFFNERKLPLR